MKNDSLLVAARIGGLLVFHLSCFSEGASAYEYTVKNAFCQDYARNSTSRLSPTIQYDMQISYNWCMKHSDTLIRNYEADKKRLNQLELERQRKQRIESEKRKQAELQKRLEQNRKREMHKKEVDSILKNADNLFR